MRRPYRDEVQHLAAWCADNKLVLNTQKTKEIIVDSRRARSHAHTHIYINGVGATRGVKIQVPWHPHLQ